MHCKYYLFREQAVRGGEDIPRRYGDPTAIGVVLHLLPLGLPAANLVDEGLPRNLQNVICREMSNFYVWRPRHFGVEAQNETLVKYLAVESVSPGHDSRHPNVAKVVRVPP